MKDNTCNYSDNWSPYIGDYDKFEYDIKLKDGTIVENCYPNADNFNSISDEHDGQDFPASEVVEIRFSEKPRFGINEGVSGRPQYEWLNRNKVIEYEVKKYKRSLLPIEDNDLVVNIYTCEVEKCILACEDGTGVIELPSGMRASLPLCNYKKLVPVDKRILVVVGGSKLYEVSEEMLKRINETESSREENEQMVIEQGKFVENYAPKPKSNVVDKYTPYLSLLNDSSIYHDLAEYDKYLYEGRSKAEMFATLHPVRNSKKDPKIPRNNPCPCGSGKKYKKCCGN